jgi:hypothetical protein
VYEKLGIVNREPVIGEDPRYVQRNDLKKYYCGLIEGSEGQEGKPIDVTGEFGNINKDQPTITENTPRPRINTAGRIAIIIGGIVLITICLCWVIGLLVDAIPELLNRPTRTPTNTATFTLTPSFTPTYTFTPSHTPTITNTPTNTLTPTITNTPTNTFTPIATRTATISPILFEDNFDRGGKPDWVIEGNPVYVNKQLTTAEDLHMYIGDETWTDYSVSFDASSIDNTFSVGIRTMDSANYLAVKFNWSTIAFAIMRAGILTDVPHGSARINSRAYKVKVSATGNEFLVYKDGDLLKTYINNEFPSGGVGLHLPRNTVIDNFVVTRLP